MGTDQKCSLGVGCEEAGVCYADAHGEPDRCGLPPSAPKCACVSLDAKVCADRRYNRYIFDDCDHEFYEEGEPCECSCHIEFEEEDYWL